MIACPSCGFEQCVCDPEVRVCPAVEIVGDHPWAGHRGVITSVERIQYVGAMARVLLDPADDVPEGQACYAERKHLLLLGP